jgi:hypothetical protein
MERKVKRRNEKAKHRAHFIIRLVCLQVIKNFKKKEKVQKLMALMKPVELLN